MLVNKNNMRITTLPHQDRFDKFVDKIGERRYLEIENIVKNMIAEANKSNKQVNVAAWLEGYDWETEPLKNLVRVCSTKRIAGMRMGQIVFKVFMELETELWMVFRAKTIGKHGSNVYKKM